MRQALRKVLKGLNKHGSGYKNICVHILTGL